MEDKEDGVTSWRAILAGLLMALGILLPVFAWLHHS